jgi:hypothetical protein
MKMFCNRCGTPLQPDYNLCPKCGSRIIGAAGSGDAARFAGHLRTLGILWIVLSAFWFLPSIGLLTVGHAFRFMAGNIEPFARIVVPPVMFGLSAGFLVLAAAGMCVGWGLMQHEPWARIAAIVLGILSLIHPPFGTLLGAYTLWVLLSNDANAYERAAMR